MSAKPPPAPQKNKSPKGPGSKPSEKPSDLPGTATSENVEQQGRTGNTKQNTRHPGSHGSRGR